ncbi:MAG: diguanylate cyclase [Rubrobacteraceae bacterium]|nr:HD domain-containing protein [Rubrobacteraceae bacterium]MCL6437657.1 diguanylate cyclase [Rubrobacteraceae bacterium]
MADLESARSPGPGLIRVLVAGAVLTLLGAGWPVEAAWWAYLGAVLAIPLGISRAWGWPGPLVREPLFWAAADALCASLVVFGTGGADSWFFVLYLISALGLSRFEQAEKVLLSGPVLMAGYLAASLAQGERTLTPGLGVRAATILFVFGLAAATSMKLQEASRRERELSEALRESHEQEERELELLVRLAPLLANLSLESVLQWTAETASALTGAPYAHAALLDGASHRTFTADEREAYPNWWHPEIQKLLLWSCRERRVVRSEEEVCGMRGFLAVPFAPAGSEPSGALVIGGMESSPADERALEMLTAQVAPALEKNRTRAAGGRDHLTGLPGYSSLHRALSSELSGERQVTLLAADINGLRRYNRAHGLAAGDLLLKDIARSLERLELEAFRCGGDEFAVLLRGSSRARANRTSRLVQQTVDRLTSGSRTPLSASVGYVLSRGGEDPGELIERARAAAEEAKGEGGSRWHTILPAAEQTNRTAAALVEASEVKMPYLGAHMRVVSSLVRRMAEVMGLRREEVELFSLGGLLHDVGKIGIPDEILLKEGPLTDEEYEAMKSHPVLGARILEAAGGLEDVIPAVRHHHERLDGRGYPDGLRGEEIPLAARIVFVADAFEAMTRGRPYQYRISPHEALAEIERHAGTQFDPEVASALRRVIEELPDRRTGTGG